MFVELVERGIENRGKIVPIGRVGIAPRDYEAYITLYPFDKTIEGYVQINKTIKGYKGQHACTYICIDIDNETDREGSRVSTMQVINRLNSVYNIHPNDLFIYFSGNKGFHVYLVDRLLGISGKFFDEIGAKCKSFVTETFAGIANIDPKIYEDHRIIRIPNSRHAKTGLYKIEITHAELVQGLPAILELAKQPRQLTREKLYSAISVNDRLHDDFMSYFSGVQVVSQRKDADAFWGIMDRGSRNDGYYKQACALFTHSELSEHSIFEILSAINRGASEPLDDQELKLIVRSASKSKQQKEETLKVYTFRDAIPLWLDSIRPENNKLTLGFKIFDEEMKGKLRGKVIDVIGYGGSKKSLYCQWVGYMNILSRQRVLYSSMEMGIPNLMERAINMSIEPDKYNAAFELELIDRQDRNKVIEFLDKQVGATFEDLFLMCDSSAMTVDRYDQWIKETIDRRGQVDMLIVDGLGMMGGKDKEVERYSEATRELNDLSKKYNICILLICHISKGEQRTAKDMSKAVRGSEKIIDNCDLYISMAQHLQEGIDGTPEFNNPFGNARLVNKRGSGKVIDQFFELDHKRLIFNEGQEPIRPMQRREVYS